MARRLYRFRAAGLPQFGHSGSIDWRYLEDALKTPVGRVAARVAVNPTSGVTHLVSAQYRDQLTDINVLGSYCYTTSLVSACGQIIGHWFASNREYITHKFLAAGKKASPILPCRRCFGLSALPSQERYRVVADVAQDRMLIGNRWESRFLPVTVAADLDYEAACAQVTDFRSAGRGTEGREYRNLRMEPA